MNIFRSHYRLRDTGSGWYRLEERKWYSLFWNKLNVYTCHFTNIELHL